MKRDSEGVLKKPSPDQIHEWQQRVLHPALLFLLQQWWNWTRSLPLITPEQRKRIRPFFIVGAGRSGTTLLRRILMAHPEVHIPPESHGALSQVVKKHARYRGMDWQDLVSIVLGEFLSLERFFLWEIDLSPLFLELKNLPRQERSLACIVDAIYRHHLKQYKPEAGRWGDKTPMYILRLKWIHRLFPEAQYINLIRDGRDVVASYLRAGLFPDVGQAARRWVWAVRQATRYARKWPSDKFLSLRYEALVNHPESEIQKVCRFLRLEYQPGMLERVQPGVLGDAHVPHHQRVQQTIDARSIGRWKETLREDEVQAAEQIMGKWLVRLGYSASK